MWVWRGLHIGPPSTGDILYEGGEVLRAGCSLWPNKEAVLGCCSRNQSHCPGSVAYHLPPQCLLSPQKPLLTCLFIFSLTSQKMPLLETAPDLYFHFLFPLPPLPSSSSSSYPSLPPLLLFLLLFHLPLLPLLLSFSPFSPFIPSPSSFPSFSSSFFIFLFFSLFSSPFSLFFSSPPPIFPSSFPFLLFLFSLLSPASPCFSRSTYHCVRQTTLQSLSHLSVISLGLHWRTWWGLF